MVHKKHLIKYLKRYGIEKDNMLYIPWDEQEMFIILLGNSVMYSPYKTEWRSIRVIDELNTRKVLRFLQTIKKSNSIKDKTVLSLLYLVDSLERQSDDRELWNR